MSPKEQLCQRWKRSRIVTSERVLSAFMQVARENFVQADSIELAYQDHPLPIGYEQTISQPMTVLVMIQLLEVEKNHKVLEIGAGSGYNAAILSVLGQYVYSLEMIPQLVAFAKQNISCSDIKNVEVLQHDGKHGYAVAAPFDRIIVTAAASTIPEKLLEQLADNGILVIPVGDPYGCEMLKIRKQGLDFKTSKHGLFSFVPLV